jgi:hypothetical protein
MNVMIGVDPHKASHTAVAIGRDEDQIACVKVRATSRQVEELLCWAEPFEKRTWAIESVGGTGYLLAQQLVAHGEDVLDVPAAGAGHHGDRRAGRGSVRRQLLGVGIADHRVTRLVAVVAEGFCSLLARSHVDERCHGDVEAARITRLGDGAVRGHRRDAIAADQDLLSRVQIINVGFFESAGSGFKSRGAHSQAHSMAQVTRKPR